MEEDTVIGFIQGLVLINVFVFVCGWILAAPIIYIIACSAFVTLLSLSLFIKC